MNDDEGESVGNSDEASWQGGGRHDGSEMRGYWLGMAGFDGSFWGY